MTRYIEKETHGKWDLSAPSGLRIYNQDGDLVTVLKTGPNGYRHIAELALKAARELEG